MSTLNGNSTSLFHKLKSPQDLVRLFVRWFYCDFFKFDKLSSPVYTSQNGLSDLVIIRMCPMALLFPLFPATTSPPSLPPHLAFCGLQDERIISLIPRPSIPPPVFDCLQFAKTEGEGPGYPTMWSMAQNHMWSCLRCIAVLEGRLSLCFVLAMKFGQEPTKDIKCTKHIWAKRYSTERLPIDVCELSTVTKFI